MNTAYAHQATGPVSLVAAPKNHFSLQLVTTLMSRGCPTTLINYPQSPTKPIQTPCPTMSPQEANQPHQKWKFIFHLIPPINPLTSAAITAEITRLNTSVIIARNSQARMVVVVNNQLFTSQLDQLNQATTANPIQQSQLFIQEIHNCIQAARQTQTVDTRLVYVDEVYGPHLNTTIPLPVAALMSEVVNHKIIVLGDYEQLVAPIHAQDAAETVLRTMFKHKAPLAEYFTGPQSFSMINLAYLVQKHASSHGFGELTITQVPGTITTLNSNLTPTPITGAKSNQAGVSLEQGISQTLQALNNHHPPPTQLPKPTKPSPQKSIKPTKPLQKKSKLLVKQLFKSKKRLRATTLAGLLAIIVLFVYPFLFTVYAANVSWKYIEAQDFNNATRWVERTHHSLQASKKRLGYLAPIGVKVFPTTFKYLDQVITAGITTTSGVKHASQAASFTTTIVEQILGEEIGDPFSQLSEANKELNAAFTDLSLAQSTLKDLEGGQISFGVGDTLHAISSQLPDIRKRLAAGQKILQITPELLGRQGRRTYLVLLQNNAELRPTGGFIGSFALITFENGQLLDIETHDVYTADGQLKGHVEPPPELKKFLGEANWYLRDVNWDPNFPTTARQAEWFLDKEMNRQVDGTIGINLFVIEDLLKTLGPIELTDYNETITANNLFQRAEFYSETDFFAGSTQKRDFLANLTMALYQKITSLSGEDGLRLALLLMRAAEQSQLQLSFRDDTAESVFSNLGFNGALKQPSCPTTISASHCIPDYIKIVESNLGVNKVNYFINRSILHQVTITPDNIEASTTLNLENTAENNTWPAGDYKNYIRLYVPDSATITSVVIDGNQLDADQVAITEEHDKKVFGFFVKIPIQSQSQITITYVLNQQFSTGHLNGYSLLFEKQSGVGSHPLTIRVSHPPNLSPTAVSPLVISEDNQLTLVTNTASDQSMVAEFARQ